MLLYRSPDAGNAAGEGVGEGGEGSGPPKIRLLVTPLEQSRLKAECAEYVADMKLTAQRDKLTLASREVFISHVSHLNLRFRVAISRNC